MGSRRKFTGTKRREKDLKYLRQSFAKDRDLLQTVICFSTAVGDAPCCPSRQSP